MPVSMFTNKLRALISSPYSSTTPSSRPSGKTFSLQPAAAHDLNYFKSIPWCNSLIQSPNWRSCTTDSRIQKSSTEDSFFAETLQSSRTVKHCLSLVSAPRSFPFDGGDGNEELAATIGKAPIQKVIVLIDIGLGLNGYPGLAHGGFLATILDEAMGILLTANQMHHNEIAAAASSSSASASSGTADERMGQVTAYLNISYKGPVRTPGVVQVIAEILSVKGRKWFLRVAVRDQDGVDLVVGESLFIEAKMVARL